MAKKKPKSKPAKPTAVKAPADVVKSINTCVIVEAKSTTSSPVLVKVCRLCETKDGPFLNVFDSDKVLAKKMQDLLPFKVEENDDLPHKICFRCSAKVEELYEFVQKCVKSQENLRITMGKKNFTSKTKIRKIWEEKLNESNMSNDDICESLIRKAMEGIKDIPLNAMPPQDLSPVRKTRSQRSPSPVSLKKDEPETRVFKPDKKEESIKLKQVNLTLEKVDKQSPPKPTRSSNTEVVENLAARTSSNKAKSTKSDDVIEPPNQKALSKTNKSRIGKPEDIDESPNKTAVNVEEQTVDTKNKKSTEPPPVPFDIMDHVSTIKVNQVGILFQCKLCNRNFLKKEVVLGHACAKNKKNTPIDNVIHTVPIPEPPKIQSTVKYIKIDNFARKNDTKKDSVKDNAKLTDNFVENQKPAVKAPVEKKTKPKVGPASRVKKLATESGSTENKSLQNNPQPSGSAQNPMNTTPLVSFPTMPSLNSRYKLIPGPNNTFTLAEDSSGNNTSENQQQAIQEKESQQKSLKRKSDSKSLEVMPKERKLHSALSGKPHSPEIIGIDDNDVDQAPATEQPYPVGLFSTVSKPSTFTTPAMKKQSYSIVQTGNPSKLLISTKPQTSNEELKKRNRKTKHVVRPEVNAEPYNVTLEHATRPKDGGFFNFINVDPLLQPSYVLPTDNIIQESQITTSTSVVNSTPKNQDKDKYACNMCSDKFSREKKLLAHIQSHFTRMDEEDLLRSEKNLNKRSKKT